MKIECITGLGIDPETGQYYSVIDRAFAPISVGEAQRLKNVLDSMTARLREPPVKKGTSDGDG